MKNQIHKLKFIKKHILLCVLFISLNVFSQNEKEICTQNTSDEIVNKAFIQNLQKREHISSNRNLENDNPICLPLVLQIVRNSNGDDFLDPLDIPRFLSTLNSYMIDINLKYYLAEIRYIDSDFYFNPSNTPDLNIFDQFEDLTATNVFILQAGNSGGGVNSVSVHLSSTVTALDLKINDWLLHEFGHQFGLKHTFSGTQCGNENQNAEHVDRTGPNSNCNTAGDGFCDTPADPGLISYPNCTPDSTDYYGIPYSPDLTNFMSYYHDKDHFSQEQYNAMQDGLTYKLNNTDYDIDGYVQTIFPNAPNLTQIESTHLYNELNWNNVSNNLGYIIERSETSGSSGFKALKLGGTPKDVTSFKDIEIEPDTNYWYRIKAINSCDAYSNIGESETENNTTYCYPSIINRCDQLLHLFPDAVTLSDAGNILFDDANFNCEEYIDVKNYCSTSLYSDNEYTINFDMHNHNEVYLNLFLDINIDGDFDDENEWIVINEVLPRRTDYQVSFTIPNHFMNEGTTALRLIVNSSQSNTDFSLNNACDFPDLTLKFVQDYCISLNNKLALSPKVILQGAALNPNTGEEMLMRDDLRVNSYIPTTSPYSDLLSCDASVFSTTGSDAIVDWVYVELRDAIDNTIVIDGTSALLQRDGDVVGIDGSSSVTFNQPDGNYHIVIKHRNHLGIMTASPITLSGNVTSVDFTDANNQITYGNNAQTISGMPVNVVTMWSGNVNGDTIVQYTGTNPDSPHILSLVLNDPGNFLNFPTYIVTGYHTEDVNMDGNTQYAGTYPDTPFILQNVLAHPGNFLNFNTYEIIEQLPEN